MSVVSNESCICAGQISLLSKTQGSFISNLQPNENKPSRSDRVHVGALEFQRVFVNGYMRVHWKSMGYYYRINYLATWGL